MSTAHTAQLIFSTKQFHFSESKFMIVFAFRSRVNSWHFFCFTGAIFEQGSGEVQLAFKFAILAHNKNVSGRRFELTAFVDVINTADAFKLSRLSKLTIFFLHPTFSFSRCSFGRNFFSHCSPFSSEQLLFLYHQCQYTLHAALY